MLKKLERIIGTGMILLALNGNNLQAKDSSANYSKNIKISNKMKMIYSGAIIVPSFLITLGIDRLIDKYGNTKNA